MQLCYKSFDILFKRPKQQEGAAGFAAVKQTIRDSILGMRSLIYQFIISLICQVFLFDWVLIIKQVLIL
jgi:hypothetical protein